MFLKKLLKILSHVEIVGNNIIKVRVVLSVLKKREA